MKGYTMWTTKNEIEFIKNIENHTVVKKSRYQLLRGYLAGLSKRVNWGPLNSKGEPHLDKEEIKRFAENELLKCA